MSLMIQTRLGYFARIAYMYMYIDLMNVITGIKTLALTELHVIISTIHVNVRVYVCLYTCM